MRPAPRRDAPGFHLLGRRGGPAGLERGLHPQPGQLRARQARAARRRAPRRPRSGLVLKACDARSLNVLLRENQVPRERPVPDRRRLRRGCARTAALPGVRWATCRRAARPAAERVPAVYDVLVGEQPRGRSSRYGCRTSGSRAGPAGSHDPGRARRRSGMPSSNAACAATPAARPARPATASSAPPSSWTPIGWASASARRKSASSIPCAPIIWRAAAPAVTSARASARSACAWTCSTPGSAARSSEPSATGPAWMPPRRRRWSTFVPSEEPGLVDRRYAMNLITDAQLRDWLAGLDARP